MKKPLLLAALLLIDPLPTSAFAFGGAHGPPVLKPPRTSAAGAPSNMLKTGTGGSNNGASTGGPSGPSSGGTTGGGTVSTGGGPRGPAGVPTGMSQADTSDFTSWEYWWLYNKDVYLDVKQHIDASVTRSGLNAAQDDARAWDETGQRILPELLTALASNEDYDPKLSSLIALARMCDGGVRARASDVSAACAKRETDSNRAVAEGAIMALGILGSEATVPDLCGLLRDTADARRKLGGRAVPERTRAFAALSLGLLGARTTNEDVRRYAVHYLTQQLTEADAATPDTHAACSIALGLIPLGADASSPAKMQGDGSSQAKKGCLAPDSFRAAELDLLLGLLENPKSPALVRAHLPQALTRLAADGVGHERVARALLARVLDPSEKDEVLQGCVLALGAMSNASGDKLDLDVRAALLRQTDTGDVQARCFALIALAQNAGRGEAGPGVEVTRNRLILGVNAGRVRERTWSAVALGVLERARNGAGGPPEASVNALSRALREAKSPEEVGAFSVGCGLAGVKAATPVLVERLGTIKETRALGYVQLALGFLDANEALAPLNAMLVESRLCSEKLPQTALALTLLEDPMLVPRLLDLLHEGTSQATLSAAASALGAVGDRRAVDPLLAVLHDPKNTPGTHAAVIAALGRICDRDTLPWQHAVASGLNYRAMTATLSAEDRGGLLDLH